MRREEVRLWVDLLSGGSASIDVEIPVTGGAGCAWSDEYLVAHVQEALAEGEVSVESAESLRDQIENELMSMGDWKC